MCINESLGQFAVPVLLSLSTAFQGFVYWSEEMTQSICRANKHDGRNLEVLLSNNTLPGGVVIVQPALQPDGRTGSLSETYSVYL